MSEDDVPVKVFEGDVQDVTFLVSLLNSGEIETNVVKRLFSGGMELYVATADAPDALALIADFKKNRTPKRE